MSPRRKSWMVSLAAAVAAVTVAGCGSGPAAAGAAAGSGGPSRPSAGDAAKPGGQDLARAGSIVVAYCRAAISGGPANSVQTLSVVALSVADGKPVAHREAQLPKGADTGPLCRAYGGRKAAAPALREAFNRDYTLVAGQLPGPGGEGTVAAAFTLQAQSTALPAPTSDGFASSPKDSLPVFQTGTSMLWYATGDKRIVSRDATKQDGPTARGTSHGGPFVLSGDQPWSRHPLESEASEVVVNPSGTMAAAPAESMPGIWPKDAPPAGFGDGYVQPTLLGRASYGEVETLPGTDTLPGTCRPAAWSDDHTLICTNGTNLYRIHFDTAFTKAEAVERLLPDTDRINHDVVLSPDGKAIAFLSEQGSNIDLYRLDLAPGATPQKITSVQSAAASAQGDPQLITWQ